MRRVMAAHTGQVHLTDPKNITHGRPGHKGTQNLAVSGTSAYRERTLTEPLGVALLEGPADMANKKSKAEMLDNLREMLRDALRLKRQGVAHARLAHAHGIIDGYMRVLLEGGIAEYRELLAVVSDERRNADGPATAELGLVAEMH
jgi:hypothetical protein